MDRFELLGYWWLPKDHGIRETAGRLTFDPQDGPRLELHGSLRGGRVVDFDTDSLFPVLQGVTEDGKEWTLLLCQLVSAQNRMPGYPLARFVVQTALKNVRYGHDAPNFNRVWIGLSHLSDWVGRSVWTSEWNVGDSPEERGFKIEYVRPPEVVAEIPSMSATARIVHSYSHGGGMSGATPRISEDVSFEIAFEEALGLEEILRRAVFPIQNLVSLATETSNAITSIKVSDPTLRLTHADDGPPLVVDVYTSVPGRDSGEGRVYPMFMLFDLPRLGDRFSDVVAGWYRVSSDLEVVLQLLFGQEYAGDTVLDFAFLAYAQAAEAYHRLRFGGTEIPLAEHETRLSKVLSTAPDEYREWLDGRLAYSNEPTLRNRLREMYDYASPTMTQVADRTKFVRALVNHRNTLTHRDRVASEELDWELVYFTMDATKILLRACILTDVGFSPEEVAEMFRGSEATIRRAQAIRARLA